ncbi:MAG: hypothetical protein HKO59_00875 [Phycisphaerales bacterium]|nr:hypothetical protein [Phycisphaerales bacterium]
MPALLALGWSTVDTRAADFSLLTVDADGAATPMADAVADPTVLRQVPAIADPGVLAAIAPADRLSIELFDGDVATTVCDNVTLANGGCTITGALEGEPQSSVVITARNGRMTGIIRRAGGGTYRLRATNDGVAVLTEINEQAFPGCAGGGEANVGPNNAAGNGPNNPAAADPSGGVADGGCDDGSIIDVLVVYTPLARVAAGGVAAIEAEAQLAIDASNDAYANSGMTPRLRLVHVAETSYNETGDYFAHLNQLTNASDGVMDEVQGLRDTYGADLVSLLVDDGQYCGLAWLMATESASFANFGFSVTTWYCAAGNLSFPHELGHNMGCCHDHDNCGGGVFDYSWGHRFTGATSGLTRRTVMAYAPGTRIPYFSNPDVLYEGTPTGRPEGFADEADNARTIDETADTIANFRCAVDASGTWVGPAGGRWLEPTNWGGGVVPDGTTDVTLSTGVLIDGAGATAANVTLAGGGVLLVQDSGDLTATSITIAPGGQLSVTVGTVTSPAVTVNWGAELRLGHPTADLVATNITVDANGVLTGIGTITGDVTVAGELRPGDAVGNLAIDGDCTMQAGSSVWFDVQQDGTRDLLQASGTATLAGDCFVSLPDGAAPATGTCVSVLAAGTTVGGFDGEALPYVSYAAEMVATASPGLLTVCVNAIVPPRVDGLSGSDQFGFSVANAGDVNNDGIDDFIVGAPYNDDKGTNAGRVTVCAGDTGAVLYTRKGAHPGNRFGWSVAGAGDVDRDGYADFVVGAPYYSDSRGRIKVYSGRTGATLYIKKGKRTGDRFGYSVSGGVDINDDNYDDFLVGAPHNDDAGGKAGAVDVYSGRNGSTLVHLTGASSGDAFGWSVAGLGRANSDRFADFVVGAPKNDDRASNAGRVYVFSGRNYSVLYSIKGLRKGDQFGRAVAAAGRVDTDGRDDFIVGSPYNDPSGRSNAGRIDVYAGRDGDRLWAKSGQTAGDRLGWTVAGAGDVNGDGRADILAGAPWHDTGARPPVACTCVPGRTVRRSPSPTATPRATGSVTAWPVAATTTGTAAPRSFTARRSTTPRRATPAGCTWSSPLAARPIRLPTA